MRAKIKRHLYLGVQVRKGVNLGAEGLFYNMRKAVTLKWTKVDFRKY